MMTYTTARKNILIQDADSKTQPYSRVIVVIPKKGKSKLPKRAVQINRLAGGRTASKPGSRIGGI